MTKVSIKKNLSSMQVIKTLQVLLQGNFTMNELVDRLNLQENEAIFNNSVVCKYINTCRFCGIEIPKIQNKYFITKMPFGLDLNSSEIKLLDNLQIAVKENMTKKNCQLCDNLIDKLNKYTNKKIIRVSKNTYKITAELFDNAISENRKVKFLLKNGTEQICTPIKAIENGDQLFFNVLYKNKEKIIKSNRIAGIEVLSDKYIPRKNSDITVTYKMKAQLAKRYSLRENENILQTFDNGDITVSNYGEVKEILFSRLLRYADLCEILTPKIYREEIKLLLDNTLSNYGEKI